MTPLMTTSKDGTKIAYEKRGDGKPLVFVVGAFNDRTKGADLAAALSGAFTIYTYDRRGRGQSGDTAPYSVDREVEDLAAIIEAAGGDACVLGYSSGAVLAMHGAAAGLPIRRLVLMEAPFVTDAMRPVPDYDFTQHLQELIDEGKRGEAVESFQTEWVGIPRQYVEQMRHAPFRPALEAMAQTLVYETRVMGDLSIPDHLVKGIHIPTLVMDGHGAEWIHHTAGVLANRLAFGSHMSFPGVGHELTPALAPAVIEYLTR
jgi:pimeloyl-ACP methyl ester carboxylesterase